MKKLVFLLVLCLVVSSANAALLFKDNYNVNMFSSGGTQATPNWRIMAPGEPVYIPSQTDAYRQSGLYYGVTSGEVEGQWYGIQCGSSDGDLPVELGGPGGGLFPGNPGEGAENAVQFYMPLGGLQYVSPNIAFQTADLSVDIDVHVPLSTATGTNAWAWVGLGAQYADAASGGTGVLMAPDNQWYVFNNGAVIANGVGTFAKTLVGAPDLQMVPVAIDLIGGDITVSIDGAVVLVVCN